MKCCICGRFRQNLVTVTLTDEDKAFIVKTAGTKQPPDAYVYCKPCFKILSDRERGAQLMRGTIEIALRSKGNRNATKIADKYYQMLLSRTPAKKPS